MRTIHKAVMPMSNGTLRVSTRQHINGRGGSVLLNLGGAGGGSSYSSIDDYTSTTGINPFLGSNSIGGGFGGSLGKSKEAVNSKLESLLVKTKKGKKEKNINFNI
jgi:hypothetical protein